MNFNLSKDYVSYRPGNDRRVHYVNDNRRLGVDWTAIIIWGGGIIACFVGWWAFIRWLSKL